MTQTIKFTFEGFKIEAKFSKDSQPPFDVYELDDWDLKDESINTFYSRLLHNYDWMQQTVDEKVEAACYEALENYDKNDYIDEEH